MARPFSYTWWESHPQLYLTIYYKKKTLFYQEETIEKMAKDSNLKEEYIKVQIKKREDLKGNSGAEVVEKFFKYKIKELKKIKGDLLQKINKVLDKEEKLNLDLQKYEGEIKTFGALSSLEESMMCAPYPIFEKYDNRQVIVNGRRLGILTSSLLAAHTKTKGYPEYFKKLKKF